MPQEHRTGTTSDEEELPRPSQAEGAPDPAADDGDRESISEPSQAEGDRETVEEDLNQRGLGS